MAETVDIERIAKEVVSANTAPGTVVGVSAREGVGWDGDEILRIRIELRDDTTENLEGNVPSDILIQLNDRLIQIGEERFPVIYYETEADGVAGTQSDRSS